MNNIIITKPDSHWSVQYGDKYSNDLCWEEMIAIVVSLTFPPVMNKVPFLQWMRTKEEWEAYNLQYKTIPDAT